MSNKILERRQFLLSPFLHLGTQENGRYDQGSVAHFLQQ